MKREHPGHTGRSIRLKLAAASLIAALGAGCFLPRSPAPLARSVRPDRTVAILPIQGGDIRITVNGVAQTETEVVIRDCTKDQITAARTANRVFDALAGGSTNPLRSPSKTRAELDSAEWEKLMVYLNDPGPLDETWKRAGLTEFAAKIGGCSCLRVKLLIAYEHHPLYPRTPDWAATVTVQLEQLDPAQGRVLARSGGEAKFWGSIGVIGGPQAALPYAIGTTFGRAVDHAARKALADLFHPTSTEQISK